MEPIMDIDNLIDILKGSDQTILHGMIARDEDYFDETDSTWAIEMVKTYFKWLPEGFSWEKYEKEQWEDTEYYRKWEEWLIESGGNYIYVDYKYKQAGWSGDLFIY